MPSGQIQILPPRTIINKVGQDSEEWGENVDVDPSPLSKFGWNIVVPPSGEGSMPGISKLNFESSFFISLRGEKKKSFLLRTPFKIEDGMIYRLAACVSRGRKNCPKSVPICNPVPHSCPFHIYVQISDLRAGHPRPLLKFPPLCARISLHFI